MSFLINLIPIQYRMAAGLTLAAVALAALTGAGAYAHHKGFVAGEAKVQAVLDAEHLANSTAALKATIDNRAIEQQRITDQQEINRETSRLNEASRIARVDADSAAVGLRQRAAAIAARCGAGGSDPTAGSVRTPAHAPGDLLAGVLQRLDDAAGQLAAYADASAVAGRACERQYDTLTPAR